MCIVINLDAVCLICLQHDKQMHSIYTPDNPDIHIAQTISILSELKLDQNNESLPDKICDKCLKDLKAAWRFHKNCQAAKMIFQTIVSCNNKTPSPKLKLEECEDLAAKELAEQKIKVPQGLQIKRIQNDIDDEAGVSNKSLIPSKGEEEELIRKKSQDLLYEELAHHELVADEDEFHHLTQAGQEEEQLEEEQEQLEEEQQQVEDEQHEEYEQQKEDEQQEEDEGALIEFYLSEEVGQEEHMQDMENEITTMVTKNVEKPNVVERKIPSKYSKDTKSDLSISSVTSIPKPRSRGRPRQVVQQQMESPKSSREQSRPKPLKQTVIQNNPKMSQQNAQTVSNSAFQSRRNDSANSDQVTELPEVREVRTRKRKSLSPDTKPPKICDICGNSYRFQHALNAHMRRHYNDKPYPCEFCEKAFVSNVELRRHMRVHTGVKPYACQYCERRFSDFGSRIKHERTHTGERPYVCVTCGKSFAYPHVLSVHLRTHTGEKRFRCDHCSKGFTKKAYLQSHMEQYHNSLNNFHPDDYTTMENSQMVPMKSVALEECIFTSEIINDAANDILEEEEEEGEEYDEENQHNEDDKIILQQALMQPKADGGSDDDDDEDIHEIVEVHPDEYTIRVR